MPDKNKNKPGHTPQGPSDFSFFDLYNKGGMEVTQDNHDLILYTDGGYSTSVDRGAGAYVILDGTGERMIASRSFPVERQTSQRAELRAIIEALDALPQGAKVLVRTDSRYSISVLGKSPYKKRHSKNADLIAEYHTKRRLKELRIEFEWVRAHSGDRWNEYCDYLCIEAAGAL